MGEHRRHPRPLGAGAVAALVGAAAVAVPYLRDALVPSVSEVVAAWVLLAVGVAIVARERAVLGALVGAAGTVWVVVGLAPFLATDLIDPAERLALVPHALLVVATVVAPDATLGTRPRRLALIAAGVIAAVAGAGLDVHPLLLLGAIPLAMAGVERLRASVDSPRPARFVIGAGLVLVDLVSRGGLASASVAANGVAITLGVGAVTLLVSTAADPWTIDPRAATGIDLGDAIGRALGVGPLTVAFATAGCDQLLDSAGRPIEAAANPVEVRTADGSLLALLWPAVVIPPPALAALRQLLAVASARARLRAAERDQAWTIEVSRARLQRAGDAERELLEQRLRLGAVARIDRILARLEGRPEATAAAERAAVARDDLLAIARGLDPLGAHPDLGTALAALVASSPTRATFAGHVGEPVSATSARAAWYACSEALANVAKHAPGASARVTVDGDADTVRLSIADDGPGGADLTGSGLRGLTDRVGAVGGTMQTSSGAAGTTITILLPRREGS
jgi:hypothetical protein